MKACTVAGLRARCCEVGDCWLWSGATAGGREGYENYGRVCHLGRAWYVHRLVDHLERGPLPAGWALVRRVDVCESARCCNPDHWLRVREKRRAAVLARQGRVAGGASHRVAVALARRRAGVNKLTLAQARDIRASGEHWRVLAQRYAVSRATVYHIRRGLRWIDASPFRL